MDGVSNKGVLRELKDPQRMVDFSYSETVESMMKPMTGIRTLGDSSLRLSWTRSVPEHMRDGIRELSHLYTPPEHRRKGNANLLMFQVCYEADKKGMVLLLNVSPKTEITEYNLAKFYKSHGFVELPRQNGESLLMARQPHGRKQEG